MVVINKIFLQNLKSGVINSTPTISFGKGGSKAIAMFDEFVRTAIKTEPIQEESTQTKVLSSKNIRELKNHNNKTSLWVTDIDGTLRTIGGDGYILTSSQKACKDLKDAGIDIAIATGKSFDKVRELDVHNISNAKYVITEHGARIQRLNEDGTKELISKPIYLDIQDSQLIMQKYDEYVQSKKAKGEEIHEHLLCYYHDDVTDNDYIYTTTPIHKLSSYDRDFSTQINSFDDVKNLQMTKVLFYKDDSTDYKDMEEIRDIFAPYLKDTNANIFVSSKLFCEILNKNASKGNAIQKILEDINKRNNSEFTLKNVVSIGDADNDISSIETVQDAGGIGIAMGNGSKT